MDATATPNIIQVTGATPNIIALAGSFAERELAGSQGAVDLTGHYD